MKRWPEIMEMVEGQTKIKGIAAKFGVSPETAGKWLKQWREGELTQYGFPPPNKQDAPDIPKGSRGDNGLRSIPEREGLA